MGLAGWSAFVDRDVGGDVVLVAVLGGDGAAGEDAVAVAELDELFHPFGWVVLVDGVTAVHVQDREEVDLVVADPLAELGHGGGAEAFDGADREGGSALGVDVEILSSTRTWSRILPACLVTAVPSTDATSRAAWPVTRAVIRAMALILRTPRGSVSPSSQSWWAMAQSRS